MSVIITETPRPTISVNVTTRALEISEADIIQQELIITESNRPVLTVDENVRTLTVTAGSSVSSNGGSGDDTIYPGVITRIGNYISQIDLTGSVSWVISRSGNYISSLTNGTNTITYTRNGSNQITSWSVT